MGRKPKKLTRKEKQKIIDDYNFYGSVWRVSKVNNIGIYIVKRILKENDIEWNSKPGNHKMEEYWKYSCYQILKKDGDFKTAANLLELMKTYDVCYWRFASASKLANLLKIDEKFVVKKVKNKNYYGVDE